MQSNITFSIRHGSIFALMGGSGSGKSTVLRSMFGLLPPLNGTVLVDGEDYWAADELRQAQLSRRFGILFQSAALWSSLTVGENVALPLQMLTELDGRAICELVRLKLSLVGMAEAEIEIARGTQRRHAQEGGAGPRHGARS